MSDRLIIYDVKTFIVHDVGSTGLVVSGCALLLNIVAYLAPMKCMLSSSAIFRIGRVALSINGHMALESYSAVSTQLCLTLPW